MGKKKRRKAKSRKHGAAVAAAGRLELPDGPARTRPSQRYYDMPYSAAAPRMINPDLGLHHLVARVGHNAGVRDRRHVAGRARSPADPLGRTAGPSGAGRAWRVVHHRPGLGAAAADRTASS